MPDPRRDHRIEQFAGTILRLGVIASALIAVLGGALYLAGHGGVPADYHTFRGEPLSTCATCRPS